LVGVLENFISSSIDTTTAESWITKASDGGRRAMTHLKRALEKEDIQGDERNSLAGKHPVAGCFAITAAAIMILPSCLSPRKGRHA